MDTSDLPSKVLKVIAHELIHVSQLNSKKLTSDGNNIIWDGKPIGSPKEVDRANKNGKLHDYQPFEADAVKRQDSLKKSFIKSKYLKTQAELDPTLMYLIKSDVL